MNKITYKKRIAYIIAIMLTKLLENLIRKLNLGAGTNLPGRAARIIAPDILAFLAKQSKKELIVVTGTNGKTTTTGFIASILKRDKRKIAHNRKGANMLAGVTAAAIHNSRYNAKLDVDHCLFELDEAYFLKAVKEFNPDILLVTNLFRDQLDRYGELDATAKKIQSAIEKSSKIKPIKVILNADDPMVATLGEFSNVKRVYYGFNKVNFKNQEKFVKTPQEIANCSCGEKYNYSELFYGQIGHYNCTCGRSAPILQLAQKL